MRTAVVRILIRTCVGIKAFSASLPLNEVNPIANKVAQSLKVTLFVSSELCLLDSDLKISG